MAKFAPIYMSVYDGPDYSLDDLVLSAATFVENDAEDTEIGEITGFQPEDSTLSLVAGAPFVKLVHDDIEDEYRLVVGATASEAGTFNVTVRESNIYAFNNPRDTTFEITVNAD